jgi:DNA invertase Pin-like site-specific DNA recombinase
MSFTNDRRSTRAGTKSGRPVGRPRAIFQRDEVFRLRQEGLSLREIARRLDIGVGTVRRVLDPPTDPMEPCQKPNAEVV